MVHSDATVRLWQALGAGDHAAARDCLSAGADPAAALAIPTSVSDSDSEAGEAPAPMPPAPVPALVPEPGPAPEPEAQQEPEPVAVPEAPGEVCAACGATPRKLLRCSRCKQVWYCSTACQKRHWKQHKPGCGKPPPPPPAPAPAPPAPPANAEPQVTMPGQLEGSVQDVPSSWTPLHLAARVAKDEGGVDVIKMMVQRGADCNITVRPLPLHPRCPL